MNNTDNIQQRTQLQLENAWVQISAFRMKEGLS